MKKHSIVLLCTALTAILMSTSCTPQTSAERYARQYVYATDDGFDPNFYVKKTDSIQMMVPFFRQFQDAGAKDRAAGVLPEDAQQKVNKFHSEEFLKSIKSKEEFAGKVYTDNHTPSPKKLKAMGDAISAAYMDGYKGMR